jgi:hypothetical protein
MHGCPALHCRFPVLEELDMSRASSVDQPLLLFRLPRLHLLTVRCPASAIRHPTASLLLVSLRCAAWHVVTMASIVCRSLVCAGCGRS